MTRSLLAIAALALVSSPVAAAARPVPYWASLRATEVMARSGPGRSFPGEWLYRRAGLPVRVIKTYTIAHAEWRKIVDPDGASGWVQANLLTDRRTALVTGDVRPLRDRPDPAATTVWRAEPGVVGTISRCADDWCQIDVGNRRGFIARTDFFGLDAGERLP